LIVVVVVIAGGATAAVAITTNVPVLSYYLKICFLSYCDAVVVVCKFMLNLTVTGSMFLLANRAICKLMLMMTGTDR